MMNQHRTHHWSTFTIDVCDCQWATKKSMQLIRMQRVQVFSDWCQLVSHPSIKSKAITKRRTYKKLLQTAREDVQADISQDSEVEEGKRCDRLGDGDGGFMIEISRISNARPTLTWEASARRISGSL